MMDGVDEVNLSSYESESRAVESWGMMNRGAEFLRYLGEKVLATYSLLTYQSVAWSKVGDSLSICFFNNTYIHAIP